MQLQSTPNQQSTTGNHSAAARLHEIAAAGMQAAMGEDHIDYWYLQREIKLEQSTMSATRETRLGRACRVQARAEHHVRAEGDGQMHTRDTIM